MSDVTRAALVDLNGEVLSVLLLGDDYEPPENTTLVPLPEDQPVSPGWRYENDEFVAPEPDPEPAPMPSVMEMYQAQQDLQAQFDAMLDYLLEM